MSHPESILLLPSQRSFPCIPNCSEPSQRPDMRTCSLRVEPEGSQEADSMTIRRGSLALGGAWAPCSSGQAHAWPVTSGARWSWLTSSPDRPPGRRDARGGRVQPRCYTSHAAATTCSISDNSAGVAHGGVRESRPVQTRASGTLPRESIDRFVHRFAPAGCRRDPHAAPSPRSCEPGAIEETAVRG